MKPPIPHPSSTGQPSRHGRMDALRIAAACGHLLRSIAAHAVQALPRFLAKNWWWVIPLDFAAGWLWQASR